MLTVAEVMQRKWPGRTFEQDAQLYREVHLEHFSDFVRDEQAEHDAAAWQSVRAAVTLCADSLLVCVAALEEREIEGVRQIWDLQAVKILEAMVPILKREEAADAVP